MAEEGGDIITWVLRAVCEEVPTAQYSAGILRAEIAARRFWGGERPYVAKCPPILRDGRIPQTTFYRWMERRPTLRRQRG